jgi:hypothetical protein
MSKVLNFDLYDDFEDNDYEKDKKYVFIKSKSITKSLKL